MNSQNKSTNAASLEIGLNAVILAFSENQPMILVVRSEQGNSQVCNALPFGPFSPLDHRTLEIGLRAWVQEQTGLELGYVEQLYTFGDRGRHAEPGDKGPHNVSIGYLALTCQSDRDRTGGIWRNWYDYFPWEDWRQGKPDILTQHIEPCLKTWIKRLAQQGPQERPLNGHERLRICFGFDGAGWDEEKVLERYELLYEAGLVVEAKQDGRKAAKAWATFQPLGRPMQLDHRRILATAMSRLRGKIKYRPVIFELMQETFTLFELQKTVEAITGHHLHKQNFRRLVENAGLVESTGEVSTETGGRPAKLFRFRREVLLERPAPGVRIRPY